MRLVSLWPWRCSVVTTETLWTHPYATREKQVGSNPFNFIHPDLVTKRMFPMGLKFSNDCSAPIRIFM